jgi:hypothetical protein
VILFLMLRDTPSSVGLPEIEVAGAKEGDHEDRTSADYKAFVKKQVFLNPYIWWISLANFFVYILRFAILDWGPLLLKEMKGFRCLHTGPMVIAFEISGIVGMLLAGWATDRFFNGRGARICVFCMIGASLAMFLFWKLGSTPLVATGFPRLRRLLHLRATGAHRHHGGQSRHEARGGNRRRFHRSVWLCQHDRFGLGPRSAWFSGRVGTRHSARSWRSARWARSCSSSPGRPRHTDTPRRLITNRKTLDPARAARSTVFSYD